MKSTFLSTESPTKQAKLINRSIAYRHIGKGIPFILCNRFRGNLDTWDPAFLDALAETFEVITFDYSALGRSSGTQATSYYEMAKDVRDLAQYLNIDRFVMGGWSIGGCVAQMVVTEFPEIVSHGILIGTRPPGKDAPPVPQRFFEFALKPDNDLEDEMALFFNPQYESSRAAARASHARIRLRTKDLDIPVSKEQWEGLLKMKDYPTDAHGTYEKMRKTRIPLLSLVGEDDISFPVEHWFQTKRPVPDLPNHLPARNWPRTPAPVSRTISKVYP